MKRTLCLCAVTVGLLFFAGCAGTPPVKLPVSRLSLGHETLQSVRDRLGKPTREGTAVKNGQTVTALSYVSSQAPAQGTAGAAVSSTQTFFFHKGLLVGHVYFSTHEKDRPFFAPSTLEKIQKNKTQIEEAVNLLGRPGGEYVYPLVAAKGDRAKVYGFARFLVISYNTAGAVTQVEFAENGES